MRTKFGAGVAALAAIAMAGCGRGPAETAESEAATVAAAIEYPATKTVEQEDVFHGVAVKDPYRWLENDVRTDAEVKAWVDAQNAVTSAYLDALPARDKIRARMKELWNYERFGIPQKRGERYFFARNDGLQNQFVLYVQEGLDGAPRLLIDPNQWSADGATALGEYYPSEDGRYLAYTVQDGGSDWRTAKVMDVETGEILADTVEWIKYSGLSWAKDGSGFFYARYPEPEEGAAFQSVTLNHQVYFHRLGSAQGEDRLVYQRPDNPDHGFAAAVSDDGTNLVVTVWKGTDARYEVVLVDLQDQAAAPRTLVSGFAHDYSYIGDLGGTYFFRTDKDAPRGRIVAADVSPTGFSEWREIVPQSESVLESASLVGGRIVAQYLEDVKSAVRLFAPDGAAAGEVTLPGPGSAGGFGGAPDQSETFYSFTSFNFPTTIFRYDVASGANEVFKAPTTPFDPSAYEVKQVFYASRDGTRVPMFLAHRKGLDLSAGAPTLLYGYGGFNVSETPGFSVSRLAFMEMGGVFALANIRGGGEYGKEWHDAGRLLNKQNVFDDFIAAGEHLIETGVTTKEKLAVFGGSNGGLLVGAVVNQRPDLFAAAIPAVGVMDMLRFNQFTAGRFWVDDYGDPANEADFRNLYAYSPYHNIRPGADYPAILVTTADTDDRVVPGHSFKYAAALQAADLGPEPRLIRIETRAGHGSGKPTDKIIEEYSDMWAFVAAETGLVLPAGYGE